MTVVSSELLDVISIVTDEENIITDYSGRGMYGEKCLGIVTPNQMELIGYMLEEINDREDSKELINEFSQMIRNCRIDNMGYNYILYFPYFTVDGDE